MEAAQCIDAQKDQGRRGKRVVRSATQAIPQKVAVLQKLSKEIDFGRDKIEKLHLEQPNNTSPNRGNFRKSGITLFKFQER